MIVYPDTCFLYAELGAKEFLTFDARQGALAKASGLKGKP